MLKVSAEPFPTEGRGQAAINLLPQSPGLGAHSSFGFRTGDVLRWPLPGVALQRPLILLITLGCTLCNHPVQGLLEGKLQTVALGNAGVLALSVTLGPL